MQEKNGERRNETRANRPTKQSMVLMVTHGTSLVLLQTVTNATNYNDTIRASCIVSYNQALLHYLVGNTSCFQDEYGAN